MGKILAIVAGLYLLVLLTKPSERLQEVQGPTLPPPGSTVYSDPYTGKVLAVVKNEKVAATWGEPFQNIERAPARRATRTSPLPRYSGPRTPLYASSGQYVPVPRQRIYRPSGGEAAPVRAVQMAPVPADRVWRANLSATFHPLPAHACPFKGYTVDGQALGSDPAGRCVPATAYGGFWFNRGYEHHPGVDLYAPTGTPLFVVFDGTVEYVHPGIHPTAGRFIQVLADDGVTVQRALHLDTVEVVRGQRVYAGQRIGSTDATGIKVTGPHLHFEIAVHASTPHRGRPIDDDLVYLDPTPFLRSARLVP